MSSWAALPFCTRPGRPLIFDRDAHSLHRLSSLCQFFLSHLAHLQFAYSVWSMRTKMPGCVWLSSDPVPRPASALGRRSGPDSESAFRVPSQRVRVPVRSKFRVTWQYPSQSVRVMATRGSESASPSFGSESASGDGGSCWCAAFPPRRFSLTAVRCARLPQGGRATRPLLGAGNRAGAGGTLPHPGVGRLAVWVRLPQSAARSASLSTRAVGSSLS